MTGHLDSMVFVLYQPQDIVNVAAIIRVMSNFGLPTLRLVEPAAFDPYRILGIAHGTEALVERVERYETLADAVADCALLFGTTGRPRHAEHRVLAPRQAAPVLLETGRAAGERKVAVLFGREQDGLPNEALDLCHGVIAIPTHPDNRSLNLAQAALVIAYELWIAFSEPVVAAPAASLPADLAAGADREAMFESFRAFLEALYPGSPRIETALSRLRTMFMRTAPTQPETEALTNLLRHAVRRLG